MKYFYMGGPLFMGILTLVLISLVAWSVYHALPLFTGKVLNISKTKSRLKHIKTIGSFAAVTGILGQLIGLTSAFAILEEHGNVSQSLIAGGLKVSTIPTIYGILIFLLSLVIWFVLDNLLSQKSE